MPDILMGAPVTVEEFVPIVGKQYISPHLRSVPTGTGYTFFQYSRPVLLIPQTPTTTGTVYIYPGTSPPDDTSSIPIPSGQIIFLDARGNWFLRTSSSGTEKFLVIDAGGAGNAQAVASLLGGGSGGGTAVANRGAWAAAQKNVAAAGTPVQCSAQAVPNGFGVLVMAKVTNTGNIGVGTSSANANLTTGAPVILPPGSAVKLYVTNENLIWLDSAVNGEGVCLGVEV